MHESSFGRTAGVLFSPGKTFRSIAEWASWIWPLVLLAVVSSGVSYVAAQRTDFEDVIRQQVAASGREIPADALDQQIEMTEKMGPLFAIFGGLGPPVVGLVIALVFMVALRLFGSNIDFQGSYSVVLHGLMPMVVSSLLSLPVILSKEVIGFKDIQNGSYLMSNLGFLASEETSAPLRAALSSLDVFTIWSLILWAIGLRWVGRVSQTMATVTVVSVWLVYVLCKIGLAAAFSG